MPNTIADQLRAKLAAGPRPGPLGVMNRSQFLARQPSPADDDAAMDRGIEDDAAYDKAKGRPTLRRMNDHNKE